MDSQVCVDQLLHCGQSSMCGPEITVSGKILQCVQSDMSGPVIILWTVKYAWTSDYIVDSQVRVDQ